MFQWVKRAPNNGPATPVQRWVFNAGSPVVSGPVIGADGTVYVGTENAKLYAVKPDGKAGWSCDMPDGGGAPTYAVLTAAMPSRWTSPVTPEWSSSAEAWARTTTHSTPGCR